MTTTRFRTAGEKTQGVALLGATGVIGLDGVINLFQGDFIVTGIHGVLTLLVYRASQSLRGTT